MPESTPRDARTPTARSAQAAGALLVGGSILEIVVMAHHPSVHAHDMAAVLVQLQALSAVSAWVHGVLIALIKIADYATVIPGVALFVLGALVFVLAAMQSSFDAREVWEKIDWADEGARRNVGDGQIPEGVS